MNFTVEIELFIDPDHPYVDSLADYKSAVIDIIEDMFYDDDYITVEDISVKEAK